MKKFIKFITLTLILMSLIACAGQKFNIIEPIEKNRPDEMYAQKFTVDENKRKLDQLQQLTEQGQAVKVRPFYVRVGGGTGSLDSLSEATLADGDLSIVFDIANNTVYHYKYDASDATVSEDNPAKIFPDDRQGGTGTHLLMYTVLAYSMDQDLQTTDEVNFNQVTLPCFASQVAAGTINLGQEYCAGPDWDPTSEGLQENHIVMPTVDLGGGTYTWVLVRTNLGVQYSSGMAIQTNVYSANHELSTTEMYGGVIYVSSAATITPLAVASYSGASFVVLTVGATAVSIDPNASDKIWLDGTALDDGDKITNLSTAGDIAVCTYYSTDGWFCATNSWTDGG